MEFIARTVTNPHGQIDKETALKQLKSHPLFKPGTVVVNIEKRAGKWVAQLHEPKQPVKRRPKQAAPPFPPSDNDSDAPSDPLEEALEDEGPKDEAPDDSEDKPKEDKGDSEKVDLKSVMDLVKQIAQAVGVPTDGPGPDDMKKEGPPDDLLAPEADGPGPGPEAGPPHDETSNFSPGTKQIIHRKAPPGATPIGSPAFASTKQAAPKVASFQVEEPTDIPISEAKREIEAQYGQFGYKVKKIREAKNDQGQRTIRALVSVR